VMQRSGVTDVVKYRRKSERRLEARVHHSTMLEDRREINVLENCLVDPLRKSIEIEKHCMIIKCSSTRRDSVKLRNLSN